ncbi:histidinol dehydrogenase [Staphylococcus epidermidis]|nr:histidinol dehydrogenase [Staphylococcus epidermidis]
MGATAQANAGAIFLGAYTSESLGDYCAGPNHVLPTSGTFSSPLGVYDFQKRSSIIEVKAGAQILGKTAAVLAYGEGLQGHAGAAEMRKASPHFHQAAPLSAARSYWGW